MYNFGGVVEALNKMFVFYRDKGLDMFKDVISLPVLAYKMLLSSTEEKFSLFKEEDIGTVSQLLYHLKKSFILVILLVFHTCLQYS
jgi:hypothetical protein